MIAAFFHDHVFMRDSSGLHHSNGGLPYSTLSRYVAHFDRLVVVGRSRPMGSSGGTLAEGPGVEMDCVGNPLRLSLVLGGPLLRRHIRRVIERVDCAIIRMPSGISAIACSEAVRAGKPWLCEVVGCAWDALWNYGSVAGKVLAPQSFVSSRRWIAKAPFATYVTQEFLQRRYPCAGETIACSDVALPLPQPDVLERRIEKISAGWNGRPIALGIVGSLDLDYKGHESALRALALLVRSGLNVQLRCLGGGDPARWRTLAASLGVGDRVEFAGTLPHHAVAGWMDALDLFVIPSLQDGLPRALGEAMSRGLPAVGARTGGIPELIPAKYVHRPGDHQELTALVARLVTSPAEMKGCARANWETAGRYSSEVLDARRNAFFDRFRAYVERGGDVRKARPAA